MRIRKNTTVYVATFNGLKLKAWGLDQVIKGNVLVRVYQESCNPERWTAAPQLSKRNGREWIQPTAEMLMAMIDADFERCITPWQAQPAPAPAHGLTNGAQEAMARRRHRLGA